MPTSTPIGRVVEPIDMRAGIDGLSLRLQSALGRSPCDGRAYAFGNRRHDRIQVLVWDGTGVWRCPRLRHQGHCVWPGAGETVFTLAANQWQWLITGVDWQRLEAAPPAHWRVRAAP